MANYTRLTNLEVTGNLKTKGTMAVKGISDITRPTAAGDSYSKAQVKSIVDAVDAILTALGKPTS